MAKEAQRALLTMAAVVQAQQGPRARPLARPARAGARSMVTGVIGRLAPVARWLDARTGAGWPLGYGVVAGREA